MNRLPWFQRSSRLSMFGDDEKPPRQRRRLRYENSDCSKDKPVALQNVQEPPIQWRRDVGEHDSVVGGER
jgi:hypothetical protein